MLLNGRRVEVRDHRCRILRDRLDHIGMSGGDGGLVRRRSLLQSRLLAVVTLMELAHDRLLLNVLTRGAERTLLRRLRLLSNIQLSAFAVREGCLDLL